MVQLDAHRERPGASCGSADVAGGLAPGIGVYTGTSLGALTSVGSGATSASLNAVAGTTYRIAVDGNGGSTGTFTLEHVFGGTEGPLSAGWSAPASVKGDFNGDGFGDLAVAAPGENAAAGAVHVLPGSASGLSSTGSQFFTQNTGGIADSQEPGDLFGASLAVGDLTGDGIADLAVGAPGENAGRRCGARADRLGVGVDGHRVAVLVAELRGDRRLPGAGRSLRARRWRSATSVAARRAISRSAPR